MWDAGVAGVDDDNATGTMATSTSAKELLSLVAIDLLTSNIIYDQLEPGTNMTNLTSTSSLRVLGNTGLNQLLGGESMCTTFGLSTPCLVSATSTIPQSEQRYSTTSAALYSAGASLQPTTSPATLLIQIPKPTSTSTPTSGTTYWGNRSTGYDFSRGIIHGTEHLLWCHLDAKCLVNYTTTISTITTVIRTVVIAF
jgi:hypothetical protein